MSTTYKVLPYSLAEVKSAVELLHQRGCVKVVLPEGRRVNKLITYDRELYITRKIEEI